MSGFVDSDYTRVTEPGPILAVRLPGIYADVANTKNAILETNYSDGKLTQQTGFAAAFGDNPSHSRRLLRMASLCLDQHTQRQRCIQHR